MSTVTVGLLAHVDAGKTTLAEALLYRTGVLRSAGRVDDGSAALDSHELERRRGITIFAGEAHFPLGQLEVALLDTPGHVDFSAETERVLGVLDYAVLVVSGSDGVQAHTLTLWRLLEHYAVPTLLFFTKSDLERRSRADLLAEAQRDLSAACVDFTDKSTRDEALATCREDVLETYLQTGEVPDAAAADLLRARQVFPCFFGSGLKMTGVDEFLSALGTLLLPPALPDEFGARVFKITRGDKGERLAHLRVTGGELRVRDSVTVGGAEEKISALYRADGAKRTPVDRVTAGGVCAAAGLSAAAGDGLGYERQGAKAVLEPVMSYRVVLPQGCDAEVFLPKLRQLEEEDPLLRVTWDADLREIGVALMGKVQAEILTALVRERYDIDVTTDRGRVLLKETVAAPVEGVGHYEPLRHYAEVHVLIEPLPRGSGLQFATRCSTDDLAANWQNLILMHFGEKQHRGVLTGSPLTDVRLTLLAGRAHPKHTEGGDFRQATYRAVRQGLMKSESVLLEPYCRFRLEVPPEQIGRAISDVRRFHGSFDAPEERGALTLLRGRAPVRLFGGYAADLAAYTGGRGRLTVENDGYDVCADAAELIAEIGYEPERDLDNTPDSVFCAHGGGFAVKWDKVAEYMHLAAWDDKANAPQEVHPLRRNFRLDDKELEAIMEREFGADKHPFYRYTHTVPREEKRPDRAADGHVPRKVVLVDGYNVVYAWDVLKDLAAYNLDDARTRLLNVLCSYAAYTDSEVICVFDAYRVPGGAGRAYTYNDIGVVFTKERESADAYIEKLVNEIGKNENVTVVTSDNMIRLTALRAGVRKVRAADFEKEVIGVHGAIADFLETLNKPRPARLGDFADWALLRERPSEEGRSMK